MANGQGWGGQGSFGQNGLGQNDLGQNGAEDKGQNVGQAVTDGGRDAEGRARDLIARAREAGLGSSATLADKAGLLAQQAENHAASWYSDAREAVPSHDAAALHGVDEALGKAPPAFDQNDRLPWLESDDDEEYEGVDHKRVAMAVLAGLALTGAAVGGFWYFTHRVDNGAPVADGSVIAAPSENYKEAPKDPGGKQFAGTGDSSFAVSQGQERPAQLASSDAPAAGNAAGANAAEAAASTAAAAGASFAGGAPVAAASPKAEAPKPAAANKAPVESGPVGGVVQIAAYTSESAAVAGWNRLVQGHEMLKGMSHRIISAKIDLGTVYRLQLVTSAGGGAALCDRLKADGMPCQVKH